MRTTPDPDGYEMGDSFAVEDLLGRVQRRDDAGALPVITLACIDPDGAFEAVLLLTLPEGWPQFDFTDRVAFDHAQAVVVLSSLQRGDAVSVRGQATVRSTEPRVLEVRVEAIELLHQLNKREAREAR